MWAVPLSEDQFNATHDPDSEERDALRRELELDSDDTLYGVPVPARMTSLSDAVSRKPQT
jgi:hypothetical protein